MKKKLYVSLYALTLLVLSFVLLAFFGCSKSPKALPAPENIAVDKRILTWDSVENATGYVVYIDNEKYETEECRLDLHELTLEGGTFNIDVVASGDQKKHLDSSGMRLTVALDAPPESGIDELGFSYTYCEDVVGYEVSAGTADLTGTVVIPDYFCDYPVKKLASYALNPYWPALQSTSYKDLFPGNNKGANTVTTAVILPPHLEQIGYRAFYKVVNLTEIVIPDSVTVMGTRVFQNCTSLTRAVLPKGLTVIPAGCFEYAPLYEITIPETVVEIQANAFAYYELSSSIPEEFRPRLMSSVTIPASVQCIGAAAFFAQQNLATIVFEDVANLKSMGAGAFDSTAWLEAQPDTGIIYLETILYKCRGLLEEETLYITEPFTVVAGAFLTHSVSPKYERGPNQVNVKKIVITAPLKEIPADAFNACSSVAEIILPKGIEIIGPSSFYGEDSEYSGVKNITHVYFHGTQAEYKEVKENSRAKGAAGRDYPFRDEVVYYYSETEPSEPGNYWHYVDGEATPWFE
jgi:hypothetical protein